MTATNPTRCYCCGVSLEALVFVDRDRRTWCETCRGGCTIVGPASIARGAACPMLMRANAAPPTIID